MERVKKAVRCVPRLLGAGIAALAGIGAIYQWLATRRERDTLAHAGSFIDAGGYRLHYLVEGEGTPAVVLDTGLGASTLGWAPVIPQVATFTRVVAFDRAGLGWSDRGPRPRTSEQVVRELRILLRRAGIKPPYVLVGHSFGGLNMRLFAGTYPQMVAGMVLVDVSHEDQVARFIDPSMPQSVRRQQKMVKWFHRMLVAAASVGLIRALLHSRRIMRRYFALFSRLEPAQRDEALAQYAWTRTYRTARDEIAAFSRSCDQVRAARRSKPFPDVPLVVISAGKRAAGDSPAQQALGHRLRELLAELHTDLTTLSGKSTLVVAENSGHIVPYDEPEVVVDAIRQVVEQARELEP